LGAFPFSTAPLQPGIIGWDWFSLQLSDNSELMVFLLRHTDGQLNPASSGTLVRADSSQRHLSIDDFVITGRKQWESPQSGAVYPQDWLIEIPSERIVLEVDSAFAEQEMRTEGSTGVNYWEGSVTLKGKKGGSVVTGAGYVEMTGYARDFDREL
jgi:predicted secreted hydrolase